MKIKQNKNIFYSIFLFIMYILIFSVFWMKKYFGNIKIEELEFLILSNNKNANLDIVGNYLIEISILFCIICVVYFILIKLNRRVKNKLVLNYTLKNKNKKLTLFPLKLNKISKIIISVILITFFLFQFEKQFKIKEFISSKNSVSEIYENYYVDPKSVNINFPSKKRNLIFIYLESMETTYSKYVNDKKTVSLIPNLEKIAKENTFFSNNDSFGGLNQVSYTGWTASALVAYTSGVPLNIPINGNDYGNYESFLPGLVSLGDILEKEGYNQVYMIGSDAEFGGRKNYYSQHGNYEIMDYVSAKENGKIPNDYFEYWGYEDQKLFDFAKDKLNDLSKEKQPFNLTLLTVDTHFMDGYVDETCELKFATQYANAIYCSDSKVNKFINWIKKTTFLWKYHHCFSWRSLNNEFKFYK